MPVINTNFIKYENLNQQSNINFSLAKFNDRVLILNSNILSIIFVKFNTWTYRYLLHVETDIISNEFHKFHVYHVINHHFLIHLQLPIINLV